MALPPTIYRVAIDLSDIDRGCYEKLGVTVARHPSETAERLIARLLVYALCYEEGLTFTKGVSAGDEPDLWLKGPDGRVRLWVEVGLPDPERLIKASRHSEGVVLFVYGSGLSRWQAAHLPKLQSIDNLTILGTEQLFIDQLVARLQRSISWDLTVTEGTLYLTVDGETVETEKALLQGSE
jgi:uncharacterized protein YaeQ